MSGHRDKSSLLDSLRLLDTRPSTILETGAAAWGPKSSYLFDDYVAAYGGELSTVDIRLAPLIELVPRMSPRSSITCDDSVHFLSGWVRRNPGRRVDLVYLDSYDIEFDAPMPAAIHALREFWSIRPALRDGSLLLIDDTPTLDWFEPHHRVEEAASRAFFDQHGSLPGKGMLIDMFLRDSPGVSKLHHRYQVLYRFG